MPDETDQVPVYDRENLPVEFEVAGGAAWGEFELIEPMRAIRIEGPFDVRLPLEHALRDSLGVLKMPLGGWVAIDSNGDPFPIATEHMDALYRATSGTVTAKPSDLISDEQLGELVRERFGAWLDLDDIKAILDFAPPHGNAGEVVAVGKLEAIVKKAEG